MRHYAALAREVVAALHSAVRTLRLVRTACKYVCNAPGRLPASHFQPVSRGPVLRACGVDNLGGTFPNVTDPERSRPVCKSAKQREGTRPYEAATFSSRACPRSVGCSLVNVDIMATGSLAVPTKHVQHS